MQIEWLNRALFAITNVWGINDIRLLLADINTPRYVQDDDFTPLHLCLWFQNFNAVQSLVRQGANLHSVGEDSPGVIFQSLQRLSYYTHRHHLQIGGGFY